MENGGPCKHLLISFISCCMCTKYTINATCNMQRAGSLGALDGASTALAHQLPRAVGSASGLAAVRPLLLGKHVLVRMDNTVAVSYINRMRGIRSRRMSQLARHLFLWSHTRLKLLCAVHIPGELNRAAMRSHDSSLSPENGDSIPRRSG